MATPYNSEEGVDSNLKKKISWNNSSPGFSRSKSDSGRKTASSKANLSSSFSGQSYTDFQEYLPQNEHRKVAFEAICKDLGTLHNEPLSLSDWERFKEWCDHNDTTEYSTTTSSQAAAVYSKCRMVMIDVYGELPTEETWMNGKDWYMALHHDSYHPERLHDRAEDKGPFEEIPMDTTERQREQKRQYGSEILTRRDLDPKSQTRREVDSLRQKHEYTISEVDQLKKKIDNLEKTIEQVTKENLKLSTRRGPSPQTWRTHETAGGQTDEDSSNNFDRRRGPSPPNWRTHEAAGGQTDEDSSNNFDRRSSSNRHAEQRQHSFKGENRTSMEDMEQQFAEKEKQVEELHQGIYEQKSTIRKLSDRLEERNDQLNRAQHNIISKDNQIKCLEQEKADALRRLSTLASAKLSDNNPNITDLSDMNRPQKIAEKYSELYDNEWTDAYEYLTSGGQDHQKTVAILLHLLEKCFQYCKAVGRRQYEHLLAVACSPPCDQKDQDSGAVGAVQPGQTGKQTVTQKVVELRKVAFQHSLNAIRQAYQTDRGRDIDQSTTQEISVYMDKCLEVSWLACIQDPPLEIVSDFSPYSRVDLNIVRKYTKSGEYVDYVIWPALLLSDDGALLSKGVVQCTSRSRDDGAQPPPDHQQKRRLFNSNEDSDD